MKQSNGKRKSPSVERQLALHLVRMIECVTSEDFITTPPGPGIQSKEYQAAQVEPSEALGDASLFLKACGYGGLESIPARKKRLQAEIKEATEKGEWGKLAKLGAEMIRAEKGLSPLTTEKKPHKPRAKKETPASTETAPKERKPRKKQGVDPVLQDDRKPETADGADTISCSNCEWKGKAEVGTPCPVCGYLLK